MSEQQALFDSRPQLKLTPRQAAVLARLQAAGAGGLDADMAGAVAHELRDSEWAHSRDERCRFCGSAGLEVLRALAAKGLARYQRRQGSRPGMWLAVLEAQVEGEAPPDFEGLRGEYNALPAGF